MTKFKKPRPFRWKQFGRDLKHFRGDIGLREMARVLKIHHATYCRAEHGKPISVPDFVFLCCEMVRKPENYL